MRHTNENRLTVGYFCLEVPVRLVKQRLGNLLLYSLIGGVKRKRGQATEFAKAKRATIFTPSDASASTAHAGVVR
jgi:hypothetical protein